MKADPSLRLPHCVGPQAAPLRMTRPWVVCAFPVLNHFGDAPRGYQLKIGTWDTRELVVMLAHDARIIQRPLWLFCARDEPTMQLRFQLNRAQAWGPRRCTWSTDRGWGR